MDDVSRLEVVVDDLPADDLPNGSASHTERTFACPASLVLPRVRRPSPDADRGHGGHRFVRAVLSGIPVEKALESVDESLRSLCRAIDWRKLGADLHDVRGEVSYALDVRARTARELGVDIGRDYAGAASRAGAPLGEWEVPGSDDIEGTRFDGVPVVLDMKFGFGDVTEPEDNGQGLYFGAARSILTGAPEVEFRLARVHTDGGITIQSTVYTRFEIDSYLDEYEEALERVRQTRRVYLARGAVSVAEGTHCNYCDAFDSCPGKQALARSMLGDIVDLHGRIQAMSLEDAGRAWVKAHDEIAPLLKIVIDALKERAGREPIPTRPGKVLREVQSGRRDFSDKAAIALLKQLGATDAQIETLYKTSRFPQVRETNDPNAAAPKKARGKKAAAA